VKRALGKPVAQAEQRGGARGGREHGGSAGFSVGDRAVGGLEDGHLAPQHSGLLGRLAIPVETMSRHGVGCPCLGVLIDESGCRARMQGEGHDGEPAVAEGQHVVRDRGGGGVVIDPDPGAARGSEGGQPVGVGLVEDDEREAARDRDRQEWVISRKRVHNQSVDDRGAKCRDAAFARRRAREEHEPGVTLLGDGGDPGKELDARRVLEGIGELVGVYDPDRANATAAEAGRDGVRPWIAQPRGCGKHLLAEPRRELVRVTVGVRDRLGGYAELAGDVPERQASSRFFMTHPGEDTSTMKSSTMKRDDPRAVVVLCAVQVVDVLGVTTLVSALPRMLTSVGAPQSMAGLVAASYATSFSGLLVLGARLADRLGHRRVLLAGLLLFAGGSALAAIARSLPAVVIARIAQGAAAAGSVPAALRLLSEVTSSEQARRRALAAWSAAGAAAGASGLLVGGVLTSLAGWRAVFWLNLPAAGLLILWTVQVVPGGTQTIGARLELASSLLLTAALIGLILGTTSLQDPHTRLIGGALAGCGIAALAFLAIAHRAARWPALPALRIREPQLRIGAGASFLNTATTSSLVVLATFYLQDMRHTTAAEAGFELLPFSLCVVAGALLAGRVLQTRDPALGISAGLGVIAAGNAATLLLPAVTTLLPVCVAIAGLGIGLSSVGATTLGTDVAEERQGTAAAVLNTAAQLGTALGVSTAVLLAGVTQHDRLPLHGPALSWAIAALLALCGALATLPRRPHHRCRSAA
jgi:MFS family permease